MFFTSFRKHIIFYIIIRFNIFIICKVTFKAIFTLYTFKKIMKVRAFTLALDSRTFHASPSCNNAFFGLFPPNAIPSHIKKY